MTQDVGRSGSVEPSGSQASPGAASASPPSVSIPNAGDPSWFCERGNFWGTINQLLLCAKCGKCEAKPHNEPRHYRGIFTPQLHEICDECFDSLPASGMSAEGQDPKGLGAEPASPVREAETPK